MMQLESLRTVWQLVSKYVKHPKLRQVLSFHTLLVGGNPFSTSSIYALIAFLERDMRVWFAMGGTGEIVKGMVEAHRAPRRQVRSTKRSPRSTVDGRAASGRSSSPSG